MKYCAGCGKRKRLTFGGGAGDPHSFCTMRCAADYAAIQREAGDESFHCVDCGESSGVHTPQCSTRGEGATQ